MSKAPKPTANQPPAAKPERKTDEIRVVCRNRRALHEFEVLHKVECGIVLAGTEVKALRAGRANLEGSFARCERGEVWLYKADIPEYAQGNYMNHEPNRKRKLLLHRKEIAKFAAAAEQKGSTLVPLQLYFKGSRAKLELAVAKGRKEHDKRAALKEKDFKRETQRLKGIKRGG